MLEEESMEKKVSARSTSVTPQKAVSDSRKDNGTKFGKQARRREGSGSRTRQDGANAPPKKPVPQKYRSYDKRPRSRGYYNDRPRDEVTEETRAELGSALQQGSKKGNLNHLLNFTFAPRESTQPPLQWKGRNSWSRGKVRYNKEQFLQASCQFIVSDKGDYTANAVDPDRLVDWDLIEKVHIFSHEVPSCPICLYPPTAAKMTRCGHIYCWSCILHYLSLGDKSWRKCPICNELIEKNQLKSVMALPQHQFSVGEVITMKLMKRERGSTYAIPKPQWTERKGKLHDVNDNVDNGFLKLLIASKDDVQNIITAERNALNQQLNEEADDLTKSFIQHALELLDGREESLNGVIGQQETVNKLSDLKVSEEVKPTTPLSKLPSNKPVVEYASAFSDEEIEHETEKQSPDEGNNTINSSIASDASVPDSVLNSSVEQVIEEGQVVTVNDEQQDLTNGSCDISEDQATEELQLPQPSRANKMTENYFFYQASDGQHIYLNSLNARCFAREYGSLEHCPETITAKIVEMESVSMTVDLRKRLRYLSHLPVTCPFMVSELELRPPLVSKDTLHHFSNEIEKRRRMRQKKSREERRSFKQWQEKENPRLKVSIQSARHFPEYGGSMSSPVDVPSTVSTPSTTTSLSPTGSLVALNPNAAEFVPCSSSPVSTASSEGGSQWGAPISFAQMLQQGKAKPDARPKVKSDHRPSVKTKVRGSDSDASDNEDKIPVPEFHKTFGDAIQEALEKMNSTPDVAEAPTPSGGGRKKKGKQKKLLFSTSVNRAK